MADRRKIVVRNGYMKFLRLGPVKFGKQDRWAQAPQKRGLWAFPYPFYDEFFTYHRYQDLLPKQLHRENLDPYDSPYDKQDEWINRVGKKVVRVREFWYSGYLYTHFNGNIPHQLGWNLMSTDRLAATIRKSGGSHLYEKHQDGRVSVAATSVDHLEVFIAPGHGRIKEGKSP